LVGDVNDAVAELKRQDVGDIHVMGSGELIQTLKQANLIDEYLLLIHPIILGTGRRLFASGSPPASPRLLHSSTSRSGVLIASYEPADVQATEGTRRDQGGRATALDPASRRPGSTPPCLTLPRRSFCLCVGPESHDRQVAVTRRILTSLSRQRWFTGAPW
jgi:hypothetical protein